MQRRAWLLDASIYIFRAWFSLPERWYTDEGMPLNAVYGYASFLEELLASRHPGIELAAAFDESLGSCFRNEIYAGYKSSRELPDEALAFQLQACRTITELAGIPCFSGARYEADDYLATLSRLAHQQNVPVTVVTRDKDLGQLLRTSDDEWWDFAAKQNLNSEGFVHRFGVQPAQFADYLALVGDSVDDIPGVPGVGPKTAALLLQALPSLEEIRHNLGSIATLNIRGAASLGAKLEQHWEQIEVSRALAQLEFHIPELEQFPHCDTDARCCHEVVDFLQSLGLSGPLIQRWRRRAGQLEAASC